MCARLILCIVLLAQGGCASLPLPALGVGVRLQTGAHGRQRKTRLQLTLDWRPRTEPLGGRHATPDLPAVHGTRGDSAAPAAAPAPEATAPTDSTLHAWERQARSTALRALTSRAGATP